MLLFCWVVGRTYTAGIWCLVVNRHNTASSQTTALLSYVLGFTGCILFGLFDVTLFDARINVLGWFLLASIGVLASKPR